MNKSVLSRAIACSTSFLAMAIAATPAFAQTESTPPQPTAATTDDEVILITAQRRAQLLQDVPISVSAFSGE
ncbi:MAG: hypothetical protein ACXWU2_10475, partial [Allosphingosinicella sp.]